MAGFSPDFILMESHLPESQKKSHCDQENTFMTCNVAQTGRDSVVKIIYSCFSPSTSTDMLH